MQRHLRVVYFSALLDLRFLAVDSFAFAVLLGQPLLVAAASIYMLRHRPDFEAIYVVVGTTLTGLWSLVLLFGSNIINSDRFGGRLEYLEAAPAPLFVIVSGRMLGYLSFSLVSGLVSYAVAAWLFGYPLAVRQPLAFSVSAALALLSLWTMGMLLAPLSFLWMAFGRFLTGLEYPLYIFCGFLFPVALLPGWLRPISYVLPPYWGALALHGASSGGLTIAELAVAWTLLLLTSAGAVALSWWLFAISLKRSRREGLLGAV